MRFLADMGISPRTVAFVRDLGLNAIHLSEEGLERLSDSDILAKAVSEDRVVLTNDLGFSELVAASGAHLPSVITFRLRNMKPTNVNQHLRLILSQHQLELASGAVLSVTEGQIRVRLLPINRSSPLRHS